MNEPLSVESMMQAPPYSWPQAEKESRLCVRLDYLTRRHYERCEPFRNIVDNAFGGLRPTRYVRLVDIPFVPVSLFKSMELSSVPRDQVIKVLKSSGTTGQEVSQIYLDRGTAEVQTKVLVKIMQHFLGKDRLPMIIVDHPDVVRDRRSFSARGAGILGMLQFGRRPMYALSEDMQLDLPAVRDYVLQNAGQPILFFGFTFMVWRHFIAPLESQGLTIDAPGSVLIHSGGWKKLESERVSPEEFDRRFRQVTRAKCTLNFYGMVEQVGGVFVENPMHALQASIFSDVIIRDPHTLEPLPPGQKGLVQVLSALPESYPGFSILTEDIGEIVGEDLTEHGMLGKYFRIHGRAPQSELRGCSDTYTPIKVPA